VERHAECAVTVRQPYFSSCDFEAGDLGVGGVTSMTSVSSTCIIQSLLPKSVEHRDQLRAALNDDARTRMLAIVRASFAARQLHLVVMPRRQGCSTHGELALRPACAAAYWMIIAATLRNMTIRLVCSPLA
jgi:hypothetical protein